MRTFVIIRRCWTVFEEDDKKYKLQKNTHTHTYIHIIYYYSEHTPVQNNVAGLITSTAQTHAWQKSPPFPYLFDVTLYSIYFV